MQSVRQLTFGCFLIPVLIWIMVLNHPYNLYRNTAWFFTTVSLPRGMMCSCCTLSVSTFAVVVSCLAFSARVLSTFEYTEQELNCSLCLSKNLFCLGIFLKAAAFSQWSTHTLLVQKSVCCKSLDRGHFIKNQKVFSAQHDLELQAQQKSMEGAYISVLLYLY